MGRTLPPWVRPRTRVIQLANRLQRVVGDFDVIHHTQYNGSYLRRFKGDPLRVITIYDMIPELFPELFPKGNPHRDKQLFVESADIILCISEAAKRDLVNVYGRPTAPIVVTPLGVDLRFQPGLARPDNVPERYVLYVGRRGGYKDFDVLTKAFVGAKLPADVMLVAVGGGAFDDIEQSELVRQGISDRVFRLDLDDEGLAAAYANALCFVFPSRYEGFGLPPLEAMASGCPTILAASSAHPEVGGNAALYFPPGDYDELARLITDVESNPGLRAQCATAGLSHAARFTWRDTALLTAAAYHRALADR